MRTILLLLLLFVSALHAQKIVKADLVKPTESQKKWADSEVGVIIHFDINIYTPHSFNYAQVETLPPLSVFNPQALSADQWLASAKKTGAKYAILVVKQGTGFCLWPTKVHGYHIGNTSYKPGKGDLVAEFLAACKKYDIKPGISYNTNYNTLFRVGYTPLSEANQERYAQTVYLQLKELFSNYGEFFVICFNGGVANDTDRISQLIKQYQPNAILNQGPPNLGNQIRRVGNEDGVVPYPNWAVVDSVDLFKTDTDTLILKTSDKFIWAQGEADFPNRDKDAWQEGWLWHSSQDYQVVAADEILNRYYTSVGHNSNMLIGMVIDTTGLFPQVDSLEFVKYGRLYNQVFKTVLGEVRYVYGKDVELNLDGEKEIKNIVIQEDISYGERIKAYRIDYNQNGRWHKLLSGESVGHKRIHRIEETDTIKTSKLRIMIEKSVDMPMFKSFRVY